MKRSVVGCMLFLAACGQQSQSEPPAAAAAPDSGIVVVDSIFPMDVMIARFQAQSPRRAMDFGAAPATREELIERLLKALADSSALEMQRLALDVSEFAWLYFPTSRFAADPYRQPPSVGWMLTEQNGAKGMQRALAAYGRQSLVLGGYSCPSGPVVEGENRLWPDCVVRLKGDTTAIRLFGTIVQRGGRFKFVSLANDL